VSQKLRLNEEHVHAGRNTTLDDKGIAKTAREEKLRARDEKIKNDAEHARMEKLYRQHILKEPVPEGGFVPLGSITIAPAPAAPKKDEAKEEVMGD
jgi:7,8-dihydro-6-hydroxymethylpterin dimethyltransferase